MRQRDEIVLKAFEAAIDRLEEAVRAPFSALVRHAAIKRFEFTFELAWKSLQRYLKEEGLVAQSPREAFRVAARAGLISDDAPWGVVLEDRNLTVHTYDENLANAVYNRLKDHLSLMKQLGETLRARWRGRAAEEGVAQS